MSDRELLELAAKAAGIDLTETEDGFEADFDDSRIWNPLTDDGDALRLLVSLYSKGVVLNAGGGGVCVDIGKHSADEWCPLEGSYDPYAATRRAIVRAAAEIGKQA